MKRLLWTSFGILALGAIASCAQDVDLPKENKDYPTFASDKCVGEPTGPAICDVSLVDLIANPSVFIGHSVIVRGFVHVGFEDSGIYLHKDDFVNGLTRNGLWLEDSDELDVSKCQDQYSLLEGTFTRGGMSGHVGAWSGSIGKITRCEALETYPEYR